MIVQLFGILATLFVLLAIYAWFKPKTFQIERTAIINAPPETIHEYLADFRKWADWSPWEELDPGMQRTYSGSAEGVGAAYAWQGSKAGSGDMIITRSDPKTGVSLDLNFTKPFKANNKTDITLTSEGDNTRVNWAMHGPHPFLHRLMSIAFSMDKMVGKDFEKGLAKLKTLSEG